MATDRSNVFEALEAQHEDTEPMSARERWRAWIDLWLLAPIRIMWNDRRTRWGTIIIVFYFFMGTIGLRLVDAPVQNEGEQLMGPMQPGWLTIESASVLGLSIPWPELHFWLGTNHLGQDLFELLVHATPAMLEMAIAGGVATTAVGAVVGTVAGYKGGQVERVLMTASDIQMAIPGLPLLIVLAVAIEPRDPFVVGLLLSVDAWAGLARQLHSQVLALRSESYVEASRVVGLGSLSIIRDDILPNVMPYVMINFMGNTIRVIHASVGLYFLGVLPFTTQNWGVILHNAYGNGALFSSNTWHWLILPIFVISLLGYGVTILSQGMDRVFNPRVRARESKSAGGEETVPTE